MEKGYSIDLNPQSEQESVDQAYHHPTQWIAPLEESLKINVDGAVGALSAVATIAQDHIGSFINGATATLNPCSPEEVETSSFLIGLNLLEELPPVPIVIEGDSMVIV